MKLSIHFTINSCSVPYTFPEYICPTAECTAMILIVLSCLWMPSDFPLRFCVPRFQLGVITNLKQNIIQHALIGDSWAMDFSFNNILYFLNTLCKRSHQLKILSLQLKIKSLHNGIKIDIKSVDFKPCTFAILEIINEITNYTSCQSKNVIKF